MISLSRSLAGCSCCSYCRGDGSIRPPPCAVAWKAIAPRLTPHTHTACGRTSSPLHGTLNSYGQPCPPLLSCRRRCGCIARLLRDVSGNTVSISSLVTCHAGRPGQQCGGPGIGGWRKVGLRGKPIWYASFPSFGAGEPAAGTVSLLSGKLLNSCSQCVCMCVFFFLFFPSPPPLLPVSSRLPVLGGSCRSQQDAFPTFCAGVSQRPPGHQRPVPRTAVS